MFCYFFRPKVDIDKWDFYNYSQPKVIKENTPKKKNQGRRKQVIGTNKIHLMSRMNLMNTYDINKDAKDQSLSK